MSVEVSTSPFDAPSTVNALGQQPRLIAYLLLAYTLLVAHSIISRRRPGFDVRFALLGAVLARIAGSLLVEATGKENLLRGWDETLFLEQARQLVDLPLSPSAWLPHMTKDLHIPVFAIQQKLFGMQSGDLRITQIAISVLGILLLVAAVYDTCGAGAARIAMLLLAFEPAGVFFDGALHKEPLMVLASGLVCLGGVKIWQSLSYVGVLMAVLGIVIAVVTRSYVGFMLGIGLAVLVVHALARHRNSTVKAFPILVGVVVAAILLMPSVNKTTGSDGLKRLQSSQDANTAASKENDDAVTEGDLLLSNPEEQVSQNNLALESVDFSTKASVIKNLPRRINDVLLKPYPWQMQNVSQQLGGFGSLAALACFFMLIRYSLFLKQDLIRTSAPFLYPMTMLIIAYALSVGNAGTGFRYRTQIVTVGVALLVVLRQAVLDKRAADPNFKSNRQTRFSF